MQGKAEQRRIALDMALDGQQHMPSDKLVERAEKFFEFLIKSNEPSAPPPDPLGQS